MVEADIVNRITLKGVVVLLLVVGSALLLLLLGSGTIPPDNRDFFNIALGSWLTWTAMAIKRILDGSESSEQKNNTIAALTDAVTMAQTLPPPDSVKP